MVKNETLIREIRKVLMKKEGTIRLGQHTKIRLEQRGYFRGDIVRCIMSGSISEVQTGWNFRLQRQTPSLVIEGKDLDHNPMVIVLSSEGENRYSVVTAMLPHDKSRFTNCIG